MFHPQEMKRITIAAPRDRLEKTVEALYAAHVLHLKPHEPRPGGLQIGAPLPEAERASKALIELQVLKQASSRRQSPAARGRPAGSAMAPKKPGTLKEAEQGLARLRAEQERLAKERAGLEQKELGLAKEMEELAFLAAVGVRELSVLKECQHLERIAGYAADGRALAKVEGIVLAGKKGKNGVPVIVFVRKGEAKAREQLAGLAPVTLREWSGSVRAALEERGAAKERLAKERAGLEQKEQELQDRLAKELPGIELALLKRLRKSEAPLRFASSEHAFLVQGWVPADKRAQLEAAVAGLGKDVYFQVEEAGGDAPVQLSNPGPLRAFEFFLNLYSLPKVREIDPTFLVFLTFPIFYGVMLGDIGYGIVIFLTFLFLRLRMKRFHGLFDIILVSSLFTIAFGWFFGEFFGTEQMLGYTLHPVIHRLHDVKELLGFSLYFALAHINISLLLGFLNERRHSLRKAILGKLGWIVLQIGGIPLVIERFFHAGALPLFGLQIPFPSPMVSMAITAVGFLMIVAGEKFQGVIEIPGLISNFLSYMRLAAIGLASASLALVVNQMAGGLFAAGGLMFVVGALVLGMGHAVNIMLGMLDAFLQSLRLHYVETFPKFYEGGGERYKPFGK